jgi:hypothetical protein
VAIKTFVHSAISVPHFIYMMYVVCKLVMMNITEMLNDKTTISRGIHASLSLKLILGIISNSFQSQISVMI